MASRSPGEAPSAAQGNAPDAARGERGSAAAHAAPEPAGGPPASVGERFSRRVVLSEDDIRAGAALLADHNPLHHDPAAARAEGYPGLSASGAHTGALLMSLTATHFSQPAPDGRRRSPLGLGFELRFSRPVLAGEEFELFWTIVALTWKGSLRGWVTELDGGARSARGPLLKAGGRILLRLGAVHPPA